MVGEEIGEIRLREELDEDLLERNIYGLGGNLSVVSNVGEGPMGETGDLSPTTNSAKPGITSVPKSSVKGRGGGRSTMASKSYKKSQIWLSEFKEFCLLLSVTPPLHIHLPFRQDPITPFLS